MELRELIDRYGPIFNEGNPRLGPVRDDQDQLMNCRD